MILVEEKWHESFKNTVTYDSEIIVLMIVACYQIMDGYYYHS